MDLESFESAFTAWVQTQSGLTLHWRKNIPKAIPFPFVEAHPVSIAPKGHDYTTWEYDEVLDALDPTQEGLRTLVVQLNFKTRDQDLGDSGLFYAERFRTRTRSPGSQTALSAMCVSLVESRILTDTDYRDRSGRLVSQVAMDLFFEIRSTELDSTWGGEYIKHVTAGSQRIVVDEAGNPVLDDQGNQVVQGDAADTFTVSG